MKNLHPVFLLLIYICFLSCGGRDDFPSLQELPDELKLFLDTTAQVGGIEKDLLNIGGPLDTSENNNLVPCCGFKQIYKLKVRFYAPTTRCFDVSLPVSKKSLETAYKKTYNVDSLRLYKITTLNGKRIRKICLYSSGPWNAVLSVGPACSLTSTAQLNIYTMGSTVNFQLQGIETPPPGVKLIECKYEYTSKFPCSGISSCECISTYCSPDSDCECSFFNNWQ